MFFQERLSMKDTEIEELRQVLNILFHGCDEALRICMRTNALNAADKKNLSKKQKEILRWVAYRENPFVVQIQNSIDDMIDDRFSALWDVLKDRMEELGVEAEEE